MTSTLESWATLVQDSVETVEIIFLERPIDEFISIMNDIGGQFIEAVVTEFGEDSGVFLELLDDAILPFLGPLLGSSISSGLLADKISDLVNEGSQNANILVLSDPVVLDLDGDGVELTDLNDSNAYFDLNGNGFATHTSWLSGDDAFLAMDKNLDGTINDINELFGNSNQHGFEELSLLDSNLDGLIDQSDAQFNDLLLWQDANGDGISQTEELKSLNEHQIVSINLNSHAVNPQENSDGQIINESSYTRYDVDSDTTTGVSADVNLLTNPTFSNYIGDVTIDEAVLQVGNIKGYGLISDLHIAMSLDADLKQQVLGDIGNLNFNNSRDLFDAMLFKWANVENISLNEIDNSPSLSADAQGLIHFNNAGVNLSLKQLGVLKQYTGIDELQINDGTWQVDGKTQSTGQLYQQAWDSLYRNLFVKYVASNGLLEQVIAGISYDSQSDLILTSFNIESGAVQLFDRVFDIAEESATDQNAMNKSLIMAIVLLEAEPDAINVFASKYNSFITTANLDVVGSFMNNDLFSILPVSYIEGTSDNV